MNAQKLLLIFSCIFYCSNVLALQEAFPCKSRTNMPMRIKPTDIDVEVNSDGSSPSNNSSTWSLPGTIPIVCEGKPNTSLRDEIFYRLDLPNSPDIVKHNGKEFLMLNEYIGFATSVYVYGKNYLNVTSDGKFYSNDSNNTVTTDNDGKKNDNLTTSNKGKVFVYIRKPFIGEMRFNDFLVAELAASMQAPSEAAEHYAQVYISGVLRSTSSCEFNNNVYTIDFGNISESEIKPLTTEQSEKNAKHLNISIDCKGPMASQGVSLSIQARPDGLVSQVISTNIAGLGIKTASNGKTISPLPDITSKPAEEHLIPTTISGENRHSASLTFTPVKTASKINPGKFNASATIKVNFN